MSGHITSNSRQIGLLFVDPNFRDQLGTDHKTQPPVLTLPPNATNEWCNRCAGVKPVGSMTSDAVDPDYLAMAEELDAMREAHEEQCRLNSVFRDASAVAA